MRVTLAELACLLAGELEGDEQTIICGIAPLDQAQTGDLTFLTESKHAARAATWATVGGGPTGAEAGAAPPATAGRGDLVLVAGSLFTVGDAKRVLARA